MIERWKLRGTPEIAREKSGSVGRKSRWEEGANAHKYRCAMRTGAAPVVRNERHARASSGEALTPLIP